MLSASMLRPLTSFSLPRPQPSFGVLKTHGRLSGSAGKLSVPIEVSGAGAVSDAQLSFSDHVGAAGPAAPVQVKFVLAFAAGADTSERPPRASRPSTRTARPRALAP